MESTTQNSGRRWRFTPAGKSHLQPSAGAQSYVHFGGSKTRPKEKNGNCLCCGQTVSSDRSAHQRHGYASTIQPGCNGTSRNSRYFLPFLGCVGADRGRSLTKKTLESKEHFFRTEYMERRRTMVSIYEIPSFLGDANLAAFMLNFCDTVSASHDRMPGERRFDLMSDSKTICSIPNCLDLEGCRLPVIVSGRKPACCHCGEIGHISAVCPGKKTPKNPDKNPGTLPPVKVNDKKEAHSQSIAPGYAWSYTPYFPFVFCGNHRRLKSGVADWEKVRGRFNQRVLYPESCPRWTPTVHSLSQTYAKKKTATSPKSKHLPKTTPKQPTPAKIRCFSPRREKFEQLLDFKRRLDQERKSTPHPGPSGSTPSSPKQRRTIRSPTTPPPSSMPPPSSTLSVLKQKRDPSPLRCC